MGKFTEQEAEFYRKGIANMFKPTGVNLIDDVSEDTNKYDCEICHDFWFDEDAKVWFMSIETSEWNPYTDGLCFEDIEIKYCFECGIKL
jgi:hypothetical protein